MQLSIANHCEWRVFVTALPNSFYMLGRGKKAEIRAKFQRVSKGSKVTLYSKFKIQQPGLNRGLNVFVHLGIILVDYCNCSAIL